jgi:formylglycine-generating enzyme required for sulfatase activity
MIQETNKTGKELERWVADAYRQMGARKVEHDVEMAGHQIDVYVELEAVDHSLHRIAVEAKDYSSPVGIKIVSDFSDIVDRLRRERLIDEGIVVSAAGFSRPARNAAQTHCIRLLQPADLEVMVARVRTMAGPSEGPSYGPAVLSRTLSTDAPATILIPAGSFWIGSPLDAPDAHANEKPRRETNLPTYEIGRYPITNAQYACFLTDNPGYPVPYLDEDRAHPYNWDPKARIYPENKADHPVVLVSWEDAVTYCRWLGQVTGKHYRLPTEEEWEKAARGTFPEVRCYPWGDEYQPGICNSCEWGQSSTTSVHRFEQINQSPFGVIDMVGNAWEWTASWYERYPKSIHESLHYGRLYRVVRGGSWKNSYLEARISRRGRYKPSVRRPWLGFRIVSD